ncbi:MAG: M28 family metallopeptidase [Planctomycetota bacterium]
MAAFRPKLAFDFLKKLSFERISGSPKERKAARLIASEARKLGLRPKLEKFNVDTFSLGSAGIEVLSPYRKKYKAWPLGYSVSTPPKGMAAPLVYLDIPSEAKIKLQKGNIVLTEGAVGAKTYKVIKSSGVKALVRICPAGKEIYNKFAYEVPRKFGRFAGVSIRYEDGLDLLKRGAKKIRLKSKTANRKSTSNNVVAEIKGTGNPEEVIIVGGHYDSVPWSSGAMDNAAGSALMMALAAHFVKSPLSRTLRFVWFGCEEFGLVGSFEYVKKHAKQFRNVRFMLNLDVGGNLVGRMGVYSTGTEALATYVKIMGREFGAFSSVVEGAVPSDATPFAEKGIQALSLTRSGSPGSLMHTKGDSIEHCGPEAFELIGAFAVEFLRRIGNAVEFPFDGGPSEKIKKSVKEFVEGMGRKYKPRDNK